MPMNFQKFGICIKNRREESKVIPFQNIKHGICVDFFNQHFEAETKLPPYHRRHFQVHFLEWKCMNFSKDLTEVCSCSDYGLAPIRRQAIILTNDDLI